MSKPVIFTISAMWDDQASVWSGHCDDIPAAADAPTLDELLAKMSAMALDLLADNHPGVDPASIFLQITALRSRAGRGVNGSAVRSRPAGATSHGWLHSRAPGQGQPRDLARPITRRNFPVPAGISSRPHRQCNPAPSGIAEGFLTLHVESVAAAITP
jgi:hypothetical protein